MSGVTAKSRNLSACHLCMKLAPSALQACPRCGSAMHARKDNSMPRTLALLCTASLLYIPANLFPVMITEQLHGSTPSTILGGVVLLINMGSIPVAALIFVASVMVPVGKLITLFYLWWTVKCGAAASPRQRTIAYRITETIGKWSMVDVFVVSILVALVHIGTVLVIRPGIAAVLFAALVIITIIAAKSFDPRLFWDEQEEQHD
jgi:paraquat-inducible protein A